MSNPHFSETSSVTTKIFFNQIALFLIVNIERNERDILYFRLWSLPNTAEMFLVSWRETTRVMETESEEVRQKLSLIFGTSGHCLVSTRRMCSGFWLRGTEFESQAFCLPQSKMSAWKFRAHIHHLERKGFPVLMTERREPLDNSFFALKSTFVPCSWIRGYASVWWFKFLIELNALNGYQNGLLRLL